MKKNQHPGPFGPGYYQALVLNSRRFGHCYKHAAAPSRATFGGIGYVITSYGRSLQAGGRKFKAYAYREDGTVVRSKEIRTLLQLETATA